MRLRLQSGALARPLNFTVRRQCRHGVMRDAPHGPALVTRPRFWVATLLIGILGALLLVLRPPKEVALSNIRVRNASNLALHDITVGKVHYGDLGAGESSQYKSWGPAYRSQRVGVDVDGVRHVRDPTPELGASPLGAGRFTYVLTFFPPQSFSVTLVRE